MDNAQGQKTFEHARKPCAPSASDAMRQPVKNRLPVTQQ
jgi:hypothetical protein